LTDCLIKTKETQSQTDLSEKERKENIKGVFEIKKRKNKREKNYFSR
jgi:predicted amidophosphoribosyltransferase